MPNQDPNFLEAVRRIPEGVARSFAARERMSLDQYLKEHPDGMFFHDDFDEDGFFSDLETFADELMRKSHAASKPLTIPFVVIPCLPERLEAPDAYELIGRLCDDQEAPEDFDTNFSSEELQKLLDAFFAKGKAWWTPDRKRLIVLLPEERRYLYELATEEPSPLPEP